MAAQVKTYSKSKIDANYEVALSYVIDNMTIEEKMLKPNIYCAFTSIIDFTMVSCENDINDIIDSVLDMVKIMLPDKIDYIKGGSVDIEQYQSTMQQLKLVVLSICVLENIDDGDLILLRSMLQGIKIANKLQIESKVKLWSDRFAIVIQDFIMNGKEEKLSDIIMFMNKQ